VRSEATIDPSRTAAGFHYIGGRLAASGVALEDILAATGAAYVYDAARIDAACRALVAAFPAPLAGVRYAIKANTNPSVLARVRGHGLGAEVASGGEMMLALDAGFAPADIVLNGNGKTDAELAAAVDRGAGFVSADSPAELDRLERAAARAGRTVRALLRVNPDVDAHTHPYIATGLAETKFGMTPVEALSACARTDDWPHVTLAGLHVHIGSQLLDLHPLEDALAEALQILDAGRAAGAPLSTLDLGGGFSIDYRGDGITFPLEAWGRTLCAAGEARGLTVLVEPGRYVVGDAGALIGRVLDVKRAPARTFVVLDVAMNDLLRPALYEAHHRIVPLREPAAGAPPLVADVVGPVCESGDTFARGRTLAPLSPGDGVAILDAGAYGYAMSSNYNARGRLPEILLAAGRARRIRRGETTADLVRLACDEPLELLPPAPRS
jgi:diaminopimelate decarboxylase